MKQHTNQKQNFNSNKQYGNRFYQQSQVDTSIDEKEARLDNVFYNHRLRNKVLERTVQKNQQREALLKQQQQWYAKCYEIMSKQQAISNTDSQAVNQLQQLYASQIQEFSDATASSTIARPVELEEEEFDEQLLSTTSSLGDAVLVESKSGDVEDLEVAKFLNLVESPTVGPQSTSISDCESKTKLPSALPTFALPANYSIVSSSNKRVIAQWFQDNIWSKLSGVTDNFVVGVDTEWDFFKPLGTSGKYYHPIFPDIIQIATETSCLLIQTHEGKINPHQDFIAFVMDQRITKVFCNYVNDMFRLENWIQKHKHHMTTSQSTTSTVPNVPFLNSIINSVEVFKFIELDTKLFGAGNLCESYLSQRLEKDVNVVFSRWSRKKLERSQKKYAAIDAFLNLQLYKVMHSEIDSKTQRIWANKLRRAYYRRQVQY